MLYQITPANQAKYQTHSPNHALVLKKGDQVHVADLAGIYAMGGGAGIYGLGWNVITVNHWVASTKATAIVLEGGANAITLSANGNVTGKWNAVHIGNGAGSHKNVVTNNGKIGADHGSGILLQGSENKIVNSGIVTSGDHGIFLQGANNAIVNTGVIAAYKNNGISLEGANNKITNTGKIINDQGGCGIFIKSDGGGPAFIDNSGVIQGTVGVRLAGSVKLENSGHIGSHDLKGEWAIRSAGAASDSVFIHNAKGGYINGGYSQNGMGEGIKSAFLGSAAAETILNEGAISGDLFFSDGHDLYSGKKGTVFDDVDLGSGNDTAEGGQGADTFKMGIGNDVAHGGGGHDTIFGGDGQDKLAGGEGNDAIDGGTGNDRLEGGLGNDTLKGGAGSDTFILAQEGKGQFDLIADYAAGQDRIRIEGSCFGLGSLAGQMVSSKVFCLGSGATTADQRFLYNAATGILLYDKDGSGAAAAMKIAVFSNKPALAASDFYFI